MSDIVLRRLNANLAAASNPNPYQIFNAIFSSLDTDYDNYLVWRAGESLAALDIVKIDLGTITGTATMNDGTAIISGSGTAFVSEFKSGDWLILGGKMFEVASVDSNTQITSKTSNRTGSQLSGSIDRLEFHKALATTSYPFSPAVGIVEKATASGAMARVKVMGIVKGFSTLTQNEKIYLSYATDGSFFQGTDEDISGAFQVIGYALTEDSIMVCPSVCNQIYHEGDMSMVDRTEDTSGSTVTYTISTESKKYVFRANSGNAEADVDIKYDLTGIHDGTLKTFLVTMRASKDATSGSHTTNGIIVINTQEITLATVTGSGSLEEIKTYLFTYDPINSEWIGIELTKTS